MDSGSLFDKIISVVIALILWVYVVNVINPPSSSTIEGVPVRLLNQEVLAASNLAIAGETDYTVDVVIEGARSDILDIAEEDITANADLFGLGKGQNYLVVTVSVPEKIAVKEVKSARIPVLIDELVKVSKPVRLHMTYINKGYEIGGVTINPDEVIVIGAKSLVDAVSYVEVMVSEEKLTEEASTLQCSTKAVNADGDAMQGVRLSSAYVEVTASLYETKTVPLQVPIEGTLGDYIELVSQEIPQTITIKGPAVILENIQAIIARPVEIEGLTKDATIPVIPILPEGVEAAEESSDLTASFKLTVVKEASFDYGPGDIWIYNIPDGYEVDVLTETVTVTARGEEAIIQVLQRTDLQPAFNAAALTVGESDIQVATRYAQQMVNVELEPLTIRVRVSVSHTGDIVNE